MRGDSTDKLEVQLSLISVCTAGDDRISARRHLENARQHAMRLEENAHFNALTRRLALHLLHIGLPGEARPLLSEALLVAVTADDTLSTVALACSLSAVCLEDASFDEARKLGALVVSSAARRGNWLGVADGLITQSTCLLATDDAMTEAIALLLHGARRLNSAGASVAVNLIKARLGELRVSDEVRFDACLTDVLDQLARET